MSKESISIIVTVVVIALMFAWVPFLNIVCPPGWRSTQKSSEEEKERETKKRSVRRDKRDKRFVASLPIQPSRLRRHQCRRYLRNVYGINHEIFIGQYPQEVSGQSLILGQPLRMLALRNGEGTTFIKAKKA